MGKPVTESKTIPFQGGVNTIEEIANLPSGFFSQIQNLRPQGNSFIKRKGSSKQHSTNTDGQEGLSLGQFSKGEQAELHLYRQFLDGSVQEASNNPPTNTTGDFGTVVLAARSGAKPGILNVIKDFLVYSDDAGQHQISPGNNAKPIGFHVYKGGAVIPDIPIEGEDYTIEVTDGQTSTVAVLDSLNTLANFNCIFIGAQVRANTITFTIPLPNGTASVLALKYRKNDGTWASVSGLSDGTILSGATFGQTGSITWTLPSDEMPWFMFGKSGFWYQLSVSVALDSEVEVSACTYSGPFQNITNMWDGEMIGAFGYKKDASTGNYMDWSGDADISAFKTTDELYIGTFYKPFAFYIEATTPNKPTASISGANDVAFLDGGSGDDSITRTTADFLIKGFEAGMSAVIAGASQSGNNKTLTLKAVSASALTVQTGQLTAEAAGASSNVSITKSGTVAISEVAQWTGAAFVGLSGYSTAQDKTEGVSRSGFLTFPINSTIKRYAFNGGPFTYWTRIKFNAALGRNVLIGIKYLPFFDISQTHYPIGCANAVWKDRVAYSFNDQYIWVSAKHSPMTLNGNDGNGKVPIGDGRKNKVLAMVPFYNELLAFQEERGTKGGTVTIVEGDQPSNFDKLVISTNIGIINSKSVVVVESVNVEDTNKFLPVQTVAFFISRKGIMKCEGRSIVPISQKIGNYFDSKKTDYIRKGYEHKHWMRWDSAYNGIRIGLVSGVSATKPNVFFFLNPITLEFYQDSLDYPLADTIDIEAGSGNLGMVQVGLGANNGQVYLVNDNNTENDDDKAIHWSATMEINGRGGRIGIANERLRFKVQSTGIVNRLVAKGGNAVFGDRKTLSQRAEMAGDTFRRYNQACRGLGNDDHFSYRLTNQFSIESITRSGSTATATITNHGLETGNTIDIQGAEQSEYIGIKTITVTGVNTFTFTVSGSPATPATGTITATLAGISTQLLDIGLQIEDIEITNDK